MTTVKIPRKTIAVLPFIAILICTACSNDSTVAQNTDENVDVDNRADLATALRDGLCADTYTVIAAHIPRNAYDGRI